MEKGKILGGHNVHGFLCNVFAKGHIVRGYDDKTCRALKGDNGGKGNGMMSQKEGGFGRHYFMEQKNWRLQKGFKKVRWGEGGEGECLPKKSLGGGARIPNVG